MYQQYRPTQQGMPVVVKNILIINVLFYLGTIVLGDKFHINLYDLLGLHYFTSDLFYPHQLITHMFMHGSFMHIAFNLFSIWMFGSLLEQLWGPKRFLIFYFATGLGAAAMQLGIDSYQIEHIRALADAYAAAPSSATFDVIEWSNYLRSGGYESLLNAHQSEVINPSTIANVKGLFSDVINAKEDGVMVGASGAGYGILVGFATLFPNTLLYLYFAIPVKAKWAVAGLIAIDLFGGLSNSPTDNIAHFAHLGGALVGFLMIKYWNRNNRRSLF